MKLNKEYLKQVLKDYNFEDFEGEPIETVDDLEDYLIAQMTSNFTYDTGYVLDETRLFVEPTLYVVTGCSGDEDGVSNYLIGVYADKNKAISALKEEIDVIERETLGEKGDFDPVNLTWTFIDNDNQCFDCLKLEETKIK